MNEEGRQFSKQLWNVRADDQNKCWVFTCRTLYKLHLSRLKTEEVERSFEIPFEDLWKYFGVDVEY